MGIFKEKKSLNEVLKMLSYDNVKWYNTLLAQDNDYTEETHGQLCIRYFCTSVATQFLIAVNIHQTRKVPRCYWNLDISQIFTNSMYDSIKDYGYDDIDAQKFLNIQYDFMNKFTEYRSTYDPKLIAIDDSNSHILKAFAVDNIMNVLLSKEIITTEDEYSSAHTSICQFINTIMVESMEEFNKKYRHYKVI